MDFLQPLLSTGDKKRKLDEYSSVPEGSINYDEIPSCLSEDVPQSPKEINYGSFFFRKDIIDRFTSDSKIISSGNSTLLDRYKLYNGDDLINFISQCPGSYTRGIETTDRFTSYRNTFLNKIKQELALLCNDINESYGEQSMRRALGGDIMNYDIVVLANSNVMEDTRLQTVRVDDITQGAKWLKRRKRMMTFEEFSKYKLDSIIGFVIVEKGMCKRYPNAYGINLICSRTGSEAGIGSLLMGLYLYTIVSHPKLLSTSGFNTLQSGKATIRYELIENPDEISFQKPVFVTNDPLISIQHIGILELAGAYQNIPGLCLYEKFGFKYDPLLVKQDCFYDIENLPMILSFSSNQKYKNYWKNNIDKIKQILIKISIGYKDPDGTTYDVPVSGRSKVCGLRDRNAQKLYGLLKNMYIFEINRKQSILEDPDNDYLPLYKWLNQISKENNIFISDILTGLANGILLNKQEVAFNTRNNETYSLRLSDVYPFMNQSFGGKKYRNRKQKKTHRKLKKITSRRIKNKKTYKNKKY